MKSTIVIPTYNEVKNIEKLVKSIFKQGINTKIIIVDDDSKDGTKELADMLSKKFRQRLFVIHREKKLGIGSAYITGFRFALEKLNSDLVISMDADLSHDPKHLHSLFQKINHGFDVVVGSRYSPGGAIVGWSFDRVIISKGANCLAKKILGLKVSDVTTGYRAYKADVLKSINFGDIKSDGYSFLEEILFKAKAKGYKIGETPIVFVDRAFGKSKLSKIEMLKFFLTIIRLRFFDR